MSRRERAKQFAPFDALKGLQDALRFEEYKHERSEKGDISQEQIEAISTVIASIEKGDSVRVEFYFDGYNQVLKGLAKVDVENKILSVEGKNVAFEDILEIEKIK